MLFLAVFSQLSFCNFLPAGFSLCDSSFYRTAREALSLQHHSEPDKNFQSEVSLKPGLNLIRQHRYAYRAKT
jgi:hypothetical protein